MKALLIFLLLNLQQPPKHIATTTIKGTLYDVYYNSKTKSITYVKVKKPNGGGKL